MDVKLGYPAWLTQIDSEDSTLSLTFDDESGVLFCLLSHTTSMHLPVCDADNEAERD